MLEIRDIRVRFGGLTALDGVSFDVPDGVVCGLIGPNGAGKTTLFNVISRVYPADSGQARLNGQDLLALPGHRIARAGVARTFQNVALFPGLSVLDNVLTGAHSRSGGSWPAAALRWRTAATGRAERARAMDILRLLDLDHLALAPVEGLPFGTRKRVELARAVAAGPRLLLLDEPANGLTHEEVDALGGTIRALREHFQLSVLLVEHHMRLVMDTSDKVVVLDFGRLIADGTPDEVRQAPAVIDAYLGGAA
ncbi:ABC transporter ATP-binding protein [Streptomyces sp. NPDC006476]|uniref:ABC transporter ATP-binding protein n=1 Tax=Streptomyces sp. NPDC006476 TaxID=3157175 RepID=UPI0033A200E3